MALKPLSKAAKRRVQRALDSEDGAFEKLRNPLELHYLAWAWNWDNGFEPLRRIIRDPRCDQGTALLIYWHSRPGWFCRFASREEASAEHAEVDAYDLVKEIEERYLAGFYKAHDILFDPHNDRGTDWVKENSIIECKQPISDKMREPSPGVELAAWDDLFETRVRPITDSERAKVSRLVADGLRLLRLSDDTTQGGQAGPAQIVQLIDAYVVEHRQRTKGGPSDSKAETEADKLSERLGYLWAEQLRRAYGWDWVAWDWGDGSSVMIKPPDEDVMVKPTTTLRQALVTSFSETEPGTMARFFGELERVRSWPNKRFSELIGCGWIFLPPWVDLRERKPV